MSSRDQILKAIASNKSELTELPSISFPATEGIDLREKLRAVLTGIGGQYIEIASRQELQEYIDSLGKNPGELVLGLPGWDGNNLDAYAQGIKARFNWNVVQPAYLESVNLFRGI